MRGLLREMTRPRQSRETARFLPFFLLPLLGHCSRRSTPIPPAPRMNYLPLNAAEVALQGATTAALFGSLSYAASVVAAPMVRAVAAPSKALRLGRDIAAAVFCFDQRIRPILRFQNWLHVDQLIEGRRDVKLQRHLCMR